MTPFQVMLVASMAGLLVLTVLGIVRRWASRRTLLAWAVAWAVGLAAAIAPDATTRLAELVGIQRGKDLLLYCGVLAAMIGFFMVYVRLRRVRHDLTTLTRHIAILEAHERTDVRDG